MIGYCGTCDVSFTTLDEWEAHQHPVANARHSAGRSTVLRDGTKPHHWGSRIVRMTPEERLALRIALEALDGPGSRGSPI